MDDEERDWVPGQDPGPRFSFGAEMRRIDSHLQEMKMVKMVPELPKKRSVSDMVSDLCKDFELLSSNNLDDFLLDDHPPTTSFIPANFQEASSLPAKVENNQANFPSWRSQFEDPILDLNTHSLPGISKPPQTTFDIEKPPVVKRKSLDLKEKQFKKPPTRVAPDTGQAETSRRKSTGPQPKRESLEKRRSSKGKSARTSNNRDSNKPLTSVILPPEMIATKPVPPLSREEKSVVSIY